MKYSPLKRPLVVQGVLVDRALLTAVRRVFDTVAAACADAARRPASAARRSPRGPSRPVLRPEVTDYASSLSFYIILFDMLSKDYSRCCTRATLMEGSTPLEAMNAP